MKSSNILDCIESGDINPLEVLGIDKSSSLENLTESIIKKKYKTKALIIHPDKTNGTTELEFKILHTCYKYLIYTISEANNDYNDYFNALKNKTTLPKRNNTSSKRETDAELKKYYDKDINIYSDWNTNTKLRQQYFVDDTQASEEEYLSNVSSKKKYNNYSQIASDSDFKIKNIVFKNGKFNIDKFNAVFDKLKQQNEKQIIKYSVDELLPVHIIGDNTVTEIAKIDDHAFLHNTKKSKEMYNSIKKLNDGELKLDPSILKKVSKKDIDLQKKIRLDSKKVSSKEVAFFSKTRQDTSNINRESMESEDSFLNRQAKKYVQHKKESEQFIKKNIRVFPKSIQNNITSYLTDSSSQLNFIEYD